MMIPRLPQGNRTIALMLIAAMLLCIAIYARAGWRVVVDPWTTAQVTANAGAQKIIEDQHNFPTTVEPFNGASTGTGGEIRDRMGGGVGSWPIAGTAVYMTAYPRLDGGREWEDILPVRQWLYQTPEQILIKSSNGASDFGNKFGQPLIAGSVLTFEHQEKGEMYGYDEVIHSY